MEKKQKSDGFDLEAVGYRPVPQAFWDAWLNLFRLPEAGVKRSEEEIHDLKKKIEAMSPEEQSKMAAEIQQAITGTLNGLSRSKESN